MTDADRRAFLGSLPDVERRTFLGSLQDADRGALLHAGHRRRWEREQLLVRCGDPANSAIVLLSGLVKIHRTGADGAEVMLGICGPGDLLGERICAGRRGRE